MKAIENDQLLGFPGLAKEAVTKHLPPSTATVQGHLHNTRKNVRSTQSTPNLQSTRNFDDQFPTKEANAACELFCCAALADQNEKTIYTDLTEKFPVRSFKGNKYIFVCCAYGLNAILVRPMKSRSAEDMTTAFKDIYKYLTDRNYKPKLHVMDNECSKTI